MSDSTPPPDHEPTARIPSTEGPGESPGESSGGGPGKGLLAAGIVAGLLVAGGVGAAIAVGVTGDDDQGDSAASGSATPGPEPTPSATAGDQDTAEDVSDVDAIVSAIDAARVVADGLPVGVEERSDGTWRVELEDASGRETDVVVDESGARVVERDDDDDDDGMDGIELTRDVVQAVVDAATADTPGRVVEIQTDADADDDRFEVDVRTSDGRVVELDLDASYTVTDRDD